MIDSERAGPVREREPTNPTERPAARRALASGRRIPPRRALPGGRAVVGALLVASSLVVTFAAYTEATAMPMVSFVVARHPLHIGQTLTADDLTTIGLAPPPAPLAARIFRDPRVLIGTVVVGPVGEGELVQSSDVVEGGSRDHPFEISVAVAAARSVGGDLVIGDVVDVAATFGTGSDAYTLYVVRHARVVDFNEASSSLGSTGEQMITLALPSEQDALAVAHALAAGDVSVVRATGTPEPEGSPTPYRAPATRNAAEGDG